MLTDTHRKREIHGKLIECGHIHRDVCMMYKHTDKDTHRKMAHILLIIHTQTSTNIQSQTQKVRNTNTVRYTARHRHTNGQTQGHRNAHRSNMDK
jgi:hypothetical protein